MHCRFSNLISRRRPLEVLSGPIRCRHKIWYLAKCGRCSALPCFFLLTRSILLGWQLAGRTEQGWSQLALQGSIEPPSRGPRSSRALRLLEGAHRMVRLSSVQGRRRCYESLTMYLFCLAQPFRFQGHIIFLFYRQLHTTKQSER